MLAISLGPVALPVAPLLLLCAVWSASWLASRLADGAGGKAGADAAGSVVWHAAGWGLLAARLAHLALHADAYLATPWTVLDVRDGGWHTATGTVVGAACLLWQAARAPGLRRPLAAGVSAGVALWLVGALATGMGVKRPLPSLALTALDSGQAVTLAQSAQGRPVVVNLWASWCGPCRQEMPMFAAAQRRNAGIAFLFVNQGESVDAVRAYLSAQGLQLRGVLLDPGSRLGPAVGSRGLPTTLFYDARGRQVDAHFGVLNAAALASRLRTLRELRHDIDPR